jgi:hypothetical protein
MGVPSAVVVGALDDDPSLDGAANMPLWNRNPATLPYPTSAQSVVTVRRDVGQLEEVYSFGLLTIGVSHGKKHFTHRVLQPRVVNARE